MALLKSYTHDDPQDEVVGIKKSRRVMSSFFTNDPFVEDDSTSINKPGRSIPSMFARMLYFRTAFESIKEIRIPANKPKPIYNQLVSLCLDVLYLVYSRDSRLEVVRWNRGDQMEKLGEQGNMILREAIDKQCNDYFYKTEKDALGNNKEVFRTDDIYLFFFGDKLIGGTSPFTFAFASPDWLGLGSVKSLLDRDRDFREYVYKLFCAYGDNPAMKEFMSYVKKCKDHYEQDKELKSLDAAVIGISALTDAYTQYNYKKDNTKVWVSQLPNIPLYSLKPDEFSSDFFIDSPLQKSVDVEHTPLFLCQGYHTNLHYVGTVMWNSDIRFVSEHNENNDTQIRKLPGLKHREHIYLSMNDFLEDSLLKLPYIVDTQKFKAIVNGSNSYFLPIRPMFFQYFKVETLDTMFEYEIENERNKCVVKLTIPVTNVDGSRKNKLEVEKEYDLTNDVKAWSGRESVNLGVFPFYRIPQGDANFPNLTNRYIVMHNINGKEGEFKFSELGFYKIGNKQPIGEVEGIETDGNTKAIYYHLDKEKQDNRFDYIRMCWKREENERPGTCGIVIPIFITPKSGNQDYVYAIDFGTTNTHVAYKKTNDTNPVSFTSNEIKLQVGYLNTINTTMYQNSCGSGNVEILENEKRNFIPHINDDSYTFPLRTASKKQGAIDHQSKLFSGACIGFHYPKDFIRDEYEPELKWKLDDPTLTSKSNEINRQCKLFFEEVLWMVKNHWMLTADANKQNKPKIVVTFPQAMTMHDMILQLGRSAYMIVFGCDANTAKQKVDEMVESLAPCFRLINTTGIGNNALLNIDIGGGTTDLQYYRQWSSQGVEQIDCYYTSVLFAGDDLWGKVYEHVNTVKGAENTNNFKKAAQKFITQIIIDGISQDIANLNNLDCKEFVALLLRDETHQFTDWLSKHGNQDICRKTVFLHYSAIIYYVALWLRDNGLRNPTLIQFTGLGSKYIDFLFSDKQKLEVFTKEIITRVTGNGIEGKFEITISDRPKHATAEGAALYDPQNAITNNKVFQPGIDGMDTRINGNQLADFEEDLVKSFDNFLKTYNNLPGDIDGVYIPKLSEREINSFKENAKLSLQQMIGYYTKKFGGENAKSVNDPMFFWPFKGALSILE